MTSTVPETKFVRTRMLLLVSLPTTSLPLTPCVRARARVDRHQQARHRTKTCHLLELDVVCVKLDDDLRDDTRQLDARNFVANAAHCSKVEPTANHEQTVRRCADLADDNVKRQRRARRCAARLPQFAAVRLVVGTEQQRIADDKPICRPRGARADADVFQELRARRSSIARPQLNAGSVGLRSKYQNVTLIVCGVMGRLVRACVRACTNCTKINRDLRVRSIRPVTSSLRLSTTRCRPQFRLFSTAARRTS